MRKWNGTLPMELLFWFVIRDRNFKTCRHVGCMLLIYWKPISLAIYSGFGEIWITSHPVRLAYNYFLISACTPRLSGLFVFFQFVRRKLPARTRSVYRNGVTSCVHLLLHVTLIVAQIERLKGRRIRVCDLFPCCLHFNTK